MIGYFVIILLAAGSVLAAAFFFRHRQKQVMDGLSDMLEAAINGTFSETTFDESRQSSLENRLAQYLAASELSVRSIDAEREKIKELIADISHQTRTPLSNILLYTELLEEEPLGEAAQDSVKKLRQQSEKLQFLMDALVKLSRLETGVFVLHPIRQPLTELVVDGMESYRGKSSRQRTCDCVFRDEKSRGRRTGFMRTLIRNGPWKHWEIFSIMRSNIRTQEGLP